MNFKNEIDFLQLLFNCLEYSLISVTLDDNCRAIASPILLTLETRLTFVTISPSLTAYSILTLYCSRTTCRRACWQVYREMTNLSVPVAKYTSSCNICYSCLNFSLILLIKLNDKTVTEKMSFVCCMKVKVPGKCQIHLLNLKS